MFDTSHPWLRPLWVRLGLVVLCLGWAVFEVLAGSVGWALVFGGAGAICAHALLLTYKPESSDD